MIEKHQKKLGIAAAAVILLFSIGLRINSPNADLPSHITFSGSILTDEGNQCHNSRSKALYNEWYPDDWRITNYNPLLPYMKYAMFKIFGVGLWQLRSVSFIFAFLSLLIFFLTLKSYLYPRFGLALLGVLLLGINFLYLMYNKIGTFETSIIFWVILTFYFLEKYRSRKKIPFLVLAGASSFMAFIFKNIMAYFLPIPIAACLLLCLFHSEKKRLPLKGCIKNIFLILLGIFLILVPWYLLHYLPNKEWIGSAPGKYMGNLMFPKSLETAFRNFLNFPWKNQFYKIPIIWLGAILYIPLFFRRLLSKKTKLTETGYTLFFFAHTFVFFLMSYRPTRYFIPVIPAMVFMTILLFRQLGSSQVEKEMLPHGPVFTGLLYLFDVLWLTIVSAFCLLPLVSRYIYHFPVPKLSVKYLLGATLFVAFVYLVKYFYNKLIWKKPNFRFFFITLTILMVALSIYINIDYYLLWQRNKTYNVRNISIELGQKLENAYIAGMTAPVAVLENRHKALWLYPNFVNWDQENFEKYGLTHALLGTDVSGEINHFFNMWPERMRRAELLRIYHIKNYFLHLYSFVNPYIQAGKKEGDFHFHLTVINPSQNSVKTLVGMVCLPQKNPIKNTIKVIKSEREFELIPGENTITYSAKEIPGLLTQPVLFFLEYNRSFMENSLRYEGENFKCNTGRNIRDISASNGYVRQFDSGEHTPGFLSYGPAVPYSNGFLIADFKLKFDNIKTKIRPICQLDIYSQPDKGPLVERFIKPGDVKRNKTNLYRLYTKIPGTKTLEFRLQTTKWADVAFDYIDIKYYQGFIFDR